MLRFGDYKILEIIDEYKNPDANGDYGSVVLLKTDSDLLNYSVAVDYRDNGDKGTWTHAYSIGHLERAKVAFLDEVEKIKERVNSEIAIQRLEKTVKEQFRSFFWLETRQSQIILCKDYNQSESAGKQWKWGRLQSWLPKNEESAKTIFTWEIIKLTAKIIDDNEAHIYKAQKKIIEQYKYLILIELDDGNYALFEDGISNGIVAYFTKDEKKYARWAFESRKVEVDEFINKIKARELYEKKLELLKKKDFKLIGFTSYTDNDAISGITCSAEVTIAWEKTVEFMREHGLQFSGTYHQESEDGAPVFSNGKKLLISMRSWGGLMAESLGIDNPKDKNDMSYCAWAWGPCENSVFPNEKGIKVFVKGEEVKKEQITVDIAKELEVELEPSYVGMQRILAKQGYFNAPRIMTIEELLAEFKDVKD